MVSDYNHWLRTDPRVPKLYLDPEPGFFAAGVRRTVSSWPNTRKVKCKGLHFVQEDDPDTIGKAVANFVQSKSVCLLLKARFISFSIVRLSVKGYYNGLL